MILIFDLIFCNTITTSTTLNYDCVVMTIYTHVAYLKWENCILENVFLISIPTKGWI